MYVKSPIATTLAAITIHRENRFREGLLGVS